MAYENTGYLAFANSLAGLGQNIGGALQQRAQMQSLASLGPMIQTGDYAGASKAALEAGNQDLGIKFALLDAEKRKTAEQRALDNQVLQGVTGGVTPNPTPQPMNLPGAVPEASLPRGMRNFNPGNIEDGAFARSQPGYVGSDGRFAKFDTMEHGVGAQAGLLGKYGEKGVNTVTAIVNRYAPPSENGKATENYIKFVAGNLGVDPNAPLNLSDPNVRQKLALTMSQFENGRPVMGGASKGVQVADASGAIPAGITGDVTQPSPVDGLMAKRENILRALAVPSISDNARQQLNTLLKDTEFQIERADKRTAQVKPEMKQFGDTVYRVEGGTMTPVQKIEKTAQEKAPTNEQANAAMFATRMSEADKIISDPAIYGAGLGRQGMAKQFAENIPIVGNAISGMGETGPKYQQYRQAQRDFVNAILRKESGAAISQGEFANAEKQYFPQPGDSQEVIAQKAKNRQTAIETIANAAAPGFTKDFMSKRGGGSLNAPSAYDIQKAKEAIAAGRSQQEVSDFLRSKGLSSEGLF